jgi:hypothetical protein
VQHDREVGWLEERHPPQAEACRPRGQPHVLHGARATPHVGVGERGPAEDAGRWRAPVARDNHTDGGLPDAVQLQVEQPRPPVWGQLFRLAQPLPVGEQRGQVPRWLLSHDDKPPWL